VIGAHILRDLGVDDLRLMTNNPAKRAALESHGLTVRESVPLVTVPTAENVRYLDAKRSRMGHTLDAASSAASPAG
jgi:3,4-dihydroxy 2-butanone 4-phosphate synthase/GTP cyclohydrolase II